MVMELNLFLLKPDMLFKKSNGTSSLLLGTDSNFINLSCMKPNPFVKSLPLIFQINYIIIFIFSNNKYY